MAMSVLRHFQYFSYIVAISFIDRGSRSTRKNQRDLSQVTDKPYHIIFTSHICNIELGWLSVGCGIYGLAYMPVDVEYRAWAYCKWVVEYRADTIYQ